MMAHQKKTAAFAAAGKNGLIAKHRKVIFGVREIVAIGVLPPCGKNVEQNSAYMTCLHKIY